MRKAPIWMTLAAVLTCAPGGSAEVLYRSAAATLPAAEQLVSLESEDTPLVAALSLLAMQVGVNVLVTPGVEGQVSVHLNNVPFAQALAALTGSKGIGYHTAGDVVVVTQTADDSKAGMGTLVFRLRHLKPSDIIGAAAAFMSPTGQALPMSGGVVDGAAVAASTGGASPPIVIFRDYPENLAELEAALAVLDTPQKQVAIEVKFVETSLTDLEDVGFQWPTSLSAGVTGAPLVGNDNTSGTTTQQQAEPYSYTNDLNSSEFNWGTLGVSDVKVLMNFLAQNDRTKIISDPRISVVDNESAVINVSTTTPVQTLNRLSEGAVIQDVVTYQYIEVGITLKVQPRVSNDGWVSMKVSPTVEEILGYVGPNSSPAPVTAKRSVETTIKVKSGESIALGGLMREKEIERESKVWLLGDIPILGSLFRNKRTETEKTDLLILITPTVIDAGS